MGKQSFRCEAHEETCGLLLNGIDGPTQTEPRVQNLRVPRPPFLSRPPRSSQQAPTPARQPPTPARQPQAQNGSLGSSPFPLTPTVLPAFPRILLLALLGHPSFPCPQLCFAHTSLLSSLTLPLISCGVLVFPSGSSRLAEASLVSSSRDGQASGPPALPSSAQHSPSCAVPFPSAARTLHPAYSDHSFPLPTKQTWHFFPDPGGILAPGGSLCCHLLWAGRNTLPPLPPSFVFPFLF